MVEVEVATALSVVWIVKADREKGKVERQAVDGVNMEKERNTEKPNNVHTRVCSCVKPRLQQGAV